MSGLQYMEAARYDPQGMVRVFQELKRAGGAGGVEFLQSHPLPDTRIHYLADAIKADRSKGGRTARAEFQEMKGLI
jgi:predicted Zn-dependent protease